MKGDVVYLYAFDVAGEIAMDKVRGLLASKAVPMAIRTDHTLPKDASLYQPLSVTPELPALAFAGRPVHAVIHIYEVGVLSIVIRVPFEVKELGGLMPFHQPVLEDGRHFDQFARELCVHACESLKAAMVQVSPLPEPEAYTAFCLTDLDGERDAARWIAARRAAIAELLTENAPGGLSEAQVGEVLRVQHSYSPEDAVIIDWDAALIINLTEYVDNVLYVLEIANLQLEEYRVLDQRLDRYLDRLYSDIQRRPGWFSGTYAGVLRRLRTLRVDITKLNEEVTNITKFFGDWYLARVYLAARERFHINQWKSSVEERLKQVDALYTVAHTEISNLRMLWLEAMIVILFVIDLVAIFFME